MKLNNWTIFTNSLEAIFIHNTCHLHDNGNPIIQSNVLLEMERFHTNFHQI